MDDSIATVIGIESSAHTLGVGIVGNGRVLANARTMYKVGTKGLIPMRAADFHSKNIRHTIREALKVAGITPGEVNAIGYTKGPGIGPCLRVGQLAALTLSQKLGVPVYPVNHAVAHIEIAKLSCNLKDPIVLYVSGGNSQILGMSGAPYRHYHVYGETFDIGVGNMLDNFARAAKLRPAWGSSVEKLAEGGKYMSMPYTVKGMDFTFTGLLTNAVRRLRDAPARNVAFSLQETAFAMLCEATERAMLLTKKRELVVCGGVAQSVRLKQMLKIMARSHGVRFVSVANELNADNGAMIAVVAEKMFNAKEKTREPCTVNQKYRVDKTRINWD
jgi:N6-L-threonylcarbamoyladenine synthase